MLLETSTTSIPLESHFEYPYKVEAHRKWRENFSCLSTLGEQDSIRGLEPMWRRHVLDELVSARVRVFDL
jgi:hypothetical protein